ncbi:DNA binding domain protein [Bacillus phage 056SW001B]|uniref:DNA binding domain protein n=2 Tax=Gettysburgvirus TaxID=3425034 RepID=A0A5J6T570_9CAUD|nr:DNA binding domain protein [Bacillus phage 019DV002]QFG05242.1 DNA binding domain protein [Bacillus phage 019DV004]QFG05855.1 DNA binding domain protein [Bacillus phage 276BB001]QFG05936.1 DNA binding domain protein [Bacillus phage 280BB001]QFR56480.1 DNA binding domain protein [Bacillus phage 056SW001B]QZA70085.1 DNA binding domain protein [Bacillus phage 274BB002]
METAICSYCGEEKEIVASDNQGHKFCYDCMYGDDPNIPVCPEGDAYCEEQRNGYIDSKFMNMCYEVDQREAANDGTESEGTGEEPAPAEDSEEGA